MAVVSVTQRTPESGELGPTRSLTEEYLVITDSADDTWLTVCTAAGIPQRGSVYGGGSFLLGNPVVERIRATKSEENPKVWYVTVDYETTTLTTSEPLPQDPREWPAKIVVRSQAYTFDAVDDVAGTAIKNSAGEPLSIPVKGLALTFSVQKYFSSNRTAELMPLIATKPAKVNAAPFFGLPAESVLLSGWATQKTTINGYEVWEENFEFEVADTFHVELLDAGYYQISPSDPTKLALIKDAEGQPVPSPARLDGFGAALDADEDDVFTEYVIYPTANYGVFGLE